MTTPTDSAPPAAAHGASLILTLGRCLFADRETLGRYRSDVLAPPWINGRGETVTLAA